MDKTKIALFAATTLSVYLGCKLYDKSKALQRLRTHTKKLVEWSDIAQEVINDTWTEHPELIGELSPELNDKIQFYNIMVKENLL